MEYTIERPPTAKQLRVLDAIRSSMAENGFPPTIRAIALAMGFKSANGVMGHLNLMRRKGLVRHVVSGTSTRWLPVVPEGCCPCCSQPIPN